MHRPVRALAAAVLSVALLGASCSGAPAPAAGSGPRRLVSATPGSTPSAVTGSKPPAPDAAIPSEPRVLAQALDVGTRGLYEAIDAWLARDPQAQRSPESVELRALYQQRITRVLAREPALAERVIARLPHDVGSVTSANVEASERLFSHARPVKDATVLKVTPPEPAGTLLAYYREAEERFGVAWEVLAAVNSIESRFGRVRSASYAGARGPMQFIPSTWDAYGLGGDVHDPHDAILGAANYLAASGAPEDYRGALYHYNPVHDYVAAVMLYAKQMMRDSRTYYAYYHWQVFVFTKRGDVRLTGPGL